MTFGEYFKACRMRTGKTLEAISEECGFHLVNVRRLEHGCFPPSRAGVVLATFARALQLDHGSPEWHEFHDRAFAAHGCIPRDLMLYKDVVEHLPTLFAAMRQAAQAESMERYIEIMADIVEDRDEAEPLTEQELLAELPHPAAIPRGIDIDKAVDHIREHA